MHRSFVSVIGVVVCSVLSVEAVGASPSEYVAVRVAVSQMDGDWNSKGQNFHHPDVPYGTRKDSGTCWVHAGCVEVGGCNIFDDLVPAKDRGTRTAAYVPIAQLAQTYRSFLTRLGYPQSVWEPTIADFETYEVALIDRLARANALGGWAKLDKYGVFPVNDSDGEPFAGPLSASLGRRTQAYAATHPHVYGLLFQGGCGADEEPVKITTAPLATQVFIIPTFYYQLCHAQHVNPEDMTACDHWREVVAPVEMISGLYHYVARWADGVVRRGVLDDRDYNDGQIVLRKP